MLARSGAVAAEGCSDPAHKVIRAAREAGQRRPALAVPDPMPW